MKNICGECKFFEEGWDFEKNHWGRCKRHAPQNMGDHNEALWPEVHMNEGSCGEFKMQPIRQVERKEP